jgi:hypothetical protein
LTSGEKLNVSDYLAVIPEDQSAPSDAVDAGGEDNGSESSAEQTQVDNFWPFVDLCLNQLSVTVWNAQYL